MDSIKNKLYKLKFDNIMKYFIIFLIILSIFLLTRYLLNKKNIELFNVDQDNCKDKYLLNYGDKSINSILVDKDIRYGFFNDIKKVKNNYYDILVDVSKVSKPSEDYKIKELYMEKNKIYNKLTEYMNTEYLYKMNNMEDSKKKFLTHGDELYSKFLNPMYVFQSKLMRTNWDIRKRISEININLYRMVYESKDKSITDIVKRRGQLDNLAAYVCNPHSYQLINNNNRRIWFNRTRKVTRVEYSEKMKELKNLDDKFLNILDELGKNRKENFVSSLKLFTIDSYENTAIITPAEFKFINDDNKYPAIIGGYDFNNILFLFKINSFTESSNQDYATIFDNSIFELRLVSKKTNTNKKLFNLLLICKFSNDNSGFMLDSDITNIEINNYYYIRISVIDIVPNYSRDVCLTLLEVEKDFFGTKLYQKAGTFENSKIQNILIDTSIDTKGILKCKNTAIGRKESQLELSGDVLTNTVPSLNMDFGFVKIGGGGKININMMPDPPTTTTTTTQYIEFNTNDVIVVGGDTEKDEQIRRSIDWVNTFTKGDTRNVLEDNFKDITIDKTFENVEHFTNNEDISEINLINLSKLNKFLIEKIQYYDSIIKEYQYNTRELLALFHYNYLVLLKNRVTDFINIEKNEGRCESNKDCYISKYYLKEELNNKLKKILEDYIEDTFNNEKDGSNNPFIKSMITNDELYKTEPKGIEDEINNLLTTMNNDFNLNIDFTVQLEFVNEIKLIVDKILNSNSKKLKEFSLDELLKIEKEMSESLKSGEPSPKQKLALQKIKDTINKRQIQIDEEENQLKTDNNKEIQKMIQDGAKKQGETKCKETTNDAGRCGPKFGGKTCGGKQCCSRWGWCSGTRGKKSDWCHDQTNGFWHGVNNGTYDGADETIIGYRENGYRGNQNMTISGKTCQKWTELYPHSHENTPKKRPNMGLGDHNYCRNPDGELGGIWCYTTDPNKRWEYCDPISESLTGQNDEGYRGKQNKTRSGKKCQKWTSISPHSHENTPNKRPGKGLGDHNYCRNPNNEETIWCYTTDSNTEWEYCDPKKT